MKSGFFAYVLTLFLMSCFVNPPEAFSATPVECNQPGYTCIKSDVDYWSNVSRPSGPFTYGNQVCVSIQNYVGVRNELGVSYSSGSWVQLGTAGPACRFLVCNIWSAPVECGSADYADWVSVRQNCRPTYMGERVITSGYDPTDTSMDARGRQWCVYRKSRPIRGADPNPSGDGPGPRSGGDGGGGSDGAGGGDGDGSGSCSVGGSGPDGTDPDGGSVGSPIQPGTADKIRDELDWVDHGSAAIEFRRFYRSGLGADESRGTQGPSGLSRPWSHNHAWSLDATQVTVDGTVTLTNPRGYARQFSRAASGAWQAEGSADALQPMDAGTWMLRRASDDSALVFDAGGRITSFTDRAGRNTRYEYDDRELTSIVNAYGRRLSLQYDANGALTRVTTPDGRQIAYAYDGQGRLISVTYPDGRARGFLYEDSNVTWGLTGLVDEAGQRYATFSYDARQRAVSTELGSGLYHFTVNYHEDGAADVTDPLGTTRSYAYGTAANRLVVTAGTQPSGSGKADAASRQQDASGRITSETDFAGVRTEYAWDPVRLLPISETRAVGRPEARTITTQWHPGFALPIQRSEPGRVTNWTHDAQGNVLSRTVTDLANGASQTWQWTYTADGLVSASTEPGGAQTRYEWETGRLVRRINALGHVTRWRYDAANRVIAETAPNGTVAEYTYDPRDRIVSQSIGDDGGAAQITRFAYTPFGKLASLSLPSGLVYTYVYDGAHRLAGWNDNRGRSAVYALDAMGNRRAETVSGNGVFTIASTVNALNRVDSQTVGTQGPEQYRFDANGELASSSNALGQTRSLSLDGLRRLTTITNEAGNQAMLAYDGLNGILAARDFKGVQTQYARDAQGHAVTESSADIGTLQTSHDANGLPRRIVDALGRATTIEHDAIGRPMRIGYADGTQTVLRYDLPGASYNRGSATASIGLLSEIQDPQVTTRFERDAMGRVVSRTQIVAATHSGHGGIAQTTLTVGYEWAPAGQPGAGQLAAIRYPSGHVLRYQYDGSGQIQGLSWNGAPLLTGLTWTALGQPATWQWADVQGDAAKVHRQYDAAGHLIGNELGTYGWDAAGRLVSMRQNLLAPTLRRRGWFGWSWNPWSGNGGASHFEMAPLTIDTAFGYDVTGRLVSVQHVPVSVPTLPPGIDVSAIVGAASVSYAYDANGNRSQATYEQPGIERLQRDFVLSGTDNRIIRVESSRRHGGPDSNYVRQWVNGFSWNAAGELLGNGRLNLQYDAAGRLAQAGETVDPVSYTYNRLGQRVRKVTLHPVHGSPRAEFSVYGEDSFGDWPLAQYGRGNRSHDEDDEDDDDGLDECSRAPGNVEYLYLPTASGPMPVGVQIGRALYAIHTDHLHTPRRLTARNGQTAWQWVSSGFGEVPAATRTSGFVADGPILRIDDAPAVRFDLRYPGQVYDVETGWHYNHHRYYDPQTGRYVRADPIGMAGGWNRFGYAQTNPLRSTDSTGLCPQCFVPPLIGALWWITSHDTHTNSSSNSSDTPLTPPPTIPEGWNGDTPPSEGWEWRGKDAPGGKRGGWVSPDELESLHNDPDHGPPEGPHVDWNDPYGKHWRIYPDGRCERK